MGTNYYWYPGPACPHCGRGEDPIHIGKSSAGWCFLLNVHEDLQISDLEDWQRKWEQTGSYIEDEYGRTSTPEQMLKKITVRGRSPDAPPTPWEWYRVNNAEPGPNNLARHKIGRFCIGHGEGTWDLIVGDFS